MTVSKLRERASLASFHGVAMKGMHLDWAWRSARRAPVAALACAAALLLGVPAAAAERATVNRRTGLFEIPFSELRKAAERGDRAELARTAGRLGPARLGKALGDGDRRVVLAALEGIPLVPGGVLLLDPVVALLAAPDEGVRERAVRTVASLLAEHDAGSLAEWEISSDTVKGACQRLATVAADEKGQLTTRLQALQGLADAGPVCAGSLPPESLLGSAQPEIRRAAVLALPAGTEATTALLAAARDNDGRVAAAAGGRLCQRRAKLPVGQRPLRELARAQTAAPEDVIDMLSCLADSTDAADRATLNELREHGTAAIRDATRALVERRPQP